jgi:tRNA-specific 2-thiouridylase
MYLDHNAGGRIRAEVAAAIADWLQEPAANPSSLHAAGRRARDAMENARDEVAALLRATPAEIVFTGSGSEANGLAILGTLGAQQRGVSTPIEHASILRNLDVARARGAVVEWLEVDACGVVEAEVVVAQAHGARLLSVGWANGEIGTMQPIAAIAAGLAGIPQAVRPLLHTDAVQAAGLEELDVGTVGVDLLSLSGHKLGAPAGIGALFVRRGVDLIPLLHGGSQERERRAGTENLLGIVGFGVAARLACEGREARKVRVRALRDRLWEGLSSSVSEISRIGDPAGLAGTLAVSFAGLRGDALVVALDAAGVAASTGSACAAGAPEPSPVLLALGHDEDSARSVVRRPRAWGRRMTPEVLRERIGSVLGSERILDDLWARKPPGTRVVSAMSGGVDSSVATAVLRAAGFDVVGVSMRLGSSAQRADGHTGCCSLDDFDDARRVSACLDVPHYVVDLRDLFEAKVVDPFVETYLAGRTPNPCTLCNRDVKFDAFWDYARTAGAEAVATGHYCRILRGGTGLELHTGRDEEKDQSYFLFTLQSAELARTLFPVGDLEKGAVRALASALDLPVATKPESQDICFVSGRSYTEVVEERAGRERLRAGAIVDGTGRRVGEHSGVHHFTIGQRKGLPGGASEKQYVTAIDGETGEVRLGPAADLQRSSLVVDGVSWTERCHAGEAEVRLRHRQKRVPCRLHPRGETVEVELLERARSVSPGQAAVWYAGSKVLGGGWIASI